MSSIEKRIGIHAIATRLPWVRRLATVLAVSGVLGLAAWLRLGWPGVNSFSFDEARVSQLALQMARRGDVPVLGIPSSAGVPNLPAAIWIMALPYRLSADPLVASLFVGLLGVLAVGGLFWLARQAWGFWAGLAAALLFATSPFAVLYSRSIWAQDLLPPLAVLWAIAGALAVVRGKPWALALHLFLAGLAFQVHYAGIVLIPATAWLVIRYGLWRRWRPILLGGVPAVLAACPSIYTVWRSAPAVREAMLKIGRRPAQVDLTGLRKLAAMGAGYNWEWLPLNKGWNWSPPLALALRAASLLAALLIGAGLALLVIQALRDRGGEARTYHGVLAALVPAWALSAPLVFLRHTTPVHHQYQLPVLPALFLAAAALAQRGRRPWQVALVTGLTLGIALVQSLALARTLDIVATQLVPGGMGTPLSYPAAAARSLQDGRPILVHAYCAEPEFCGDAAGFSVLLWNYPHRLVDGRSALLLPGDGEQAHLLATYSDLPAWEEAVATGVGTDLRPLPRRQGEPPFTSMTVGTAQPQGFQLTGPWTLANGAQLVGWRARSLGGRLRFTSWWRIVGPLQPGRYHQFNHLRSAGDGEPLAIQDAPLSSAAWQVGDHLIAWADFELPAGSSGPFWVDTGMYTYPDIQRVSVLDRNGDPLAPIRLGPFNAGPDQ